MKRIYLFQVVCAVFLFSNLNAQQDAFIDGNAPIKVQKNTLFYFGGNLSVNTTTTSPNVILNDGNVQINGKLINNSSISPNNATVFKSSWTNAEEYGQVIIKNISENSTDYSGGLTMEKGTISPSEFSWGQYAIPFIYTNAEAAKIELFGGAYQDWNRYYTSMMVWDNTGKPEFDHLSRIATINPTGYYILNLVYYSAGIRGAMEGNTKLDYKGIPANKNYTANFNFDIYPTTDWTVWKENNNSYGEKYKSYISDQIRNVSNNVDYGRWFMQFGNPYTSNIDLSNIGSSSGYDDGVNLANLGGVIKLNGVNWTSSGGAVYSPTNIVATYNGTTWSGNAQALIAKPFEPFILMFNSGTGSTSFQFSDKLKTFNMTPNNPGNTTGGKMSVLNGFTVLGNRFYQVGLELYDENDNFTGNESYIVVNGAVANGIENKLESEYGDFGTRTGFFLAQEKADGSDVLNSNRKMQINAVNFSYQNKPIQLFFNRKSNDTEGYYLKSKLFYQSIFNQLKEDENNFSDGNSFFFYDSYEDVLLPITTDFSYFIEVLNDKPLTNRYQVYWNGGPSGLKVMANDEIDNSSTIIYKEQDVHKIRFNENWSSADVKVYDLSGINIQTFNGVNTNSDFVIKLPYKGVYVVKIEANNGDVYTQKIIK